MLSVSHPIHAEEHSFPTPPRYDKYSLTLVILETNAAGITVFAWKNQAEPKIRVWTPKKGPGQFAYLLELRNPKSGRYYKIFPAGQGESFSPPDWIEIKSGDSLKVRVDLRDDDRWLWPEGLPHDLSGMEIRVWYKPLAGIAPGFAADSGVTLDAFVSDWFNIRSTQ
jgi:hypothetical protein